MYQFFLLWRRQNRRGLSGRLANAVEINILRNDPDSKFDSDHFVIRQVDCLQSCAERKDLSGVLVSQTTQ